MWPPRSGYGCGGHADPGSLEPDVDLAIRPIEPSDVPAVVAMMPEPAADERAPGGGEAVGFRLDWWMLNRLAGEPLRALAAPRPYQSLRGGLRV